MIEMAKQVAAQSTATAISSAKAAAAAAHSTPPPPPPVPLTPPRSNQRPPWRPPGDTPLSNPSGVGETRSTVLDMRTDGSMLVSPARAGENGSPPRDRHVIRGNDSNTPPQSGGSRRRARRRSSKRAARNGEGMASPGLSVAVAAALAEEIEAAADSQSDLDLKERVEAWVARKSP
jgi:hypothetical protein